MKNSQEIYDKIFKIVSNMIIINIIILIIIILYDYYIIKSDNRVSKELESIIKEVVEENNNLRNKLVSQLEKLEKKNRNNDIKGWIEIEGTNINYPVLQGIDNEYYLNHNYKKHKSKYGSIFLSYKVNLEKDNQDYLIYGHNVSDGSMFNDLTKYYSKDFYETHKTIKLAIIGKEELKYEIISIFKSKVFKKRQKDIFEYYNYINLGEESIYDDYIYNVKKISIYKIELSATYGEKLITLSTCDMDNIDNRLVIVAKEMQ